MLARFQPIKFAISRWHAEADIRALSEVDNDLFLSSLQLELKLGLNHFKSPEISKNERFFSAQIDLTLEMYSALSEGSDAETPPLRLETIVVGQFTYQVSEEDELREVGVEFLQFLRRNGSAYLYSTLRPQVRSYFLNSIDRQILLPAINTAEAFQDFGIDDETLIDRFVKTS